MLQLLSFLSNAKKVPFHGNLKFNDKSSAKRSWLLTHLKNKLKVASQAPPFLPHHPPTSCRVFTSSSSHQLTNSSTSPPAQHLTNSSTSPPAQQPRARGWQKLRDRAASGCIKLWTWTKILSPTVYILYFVENLRFPDTEEKQLAFVHMKSKDGLILSRKQHTAPHQILFSTYSHDSLALQLTLMISIPMIT